MSALPAIGTALRSGPGAVMSRDAALLGRRTGAGPGEVEEIPFTALTLAVVGTDAQAQSAVLQGLADGAPVAITGSYASGHAVLTSVIAALVTLGLATDSTTA